MAGLQVRVLMLLLGLVLPALGWGGEGHHHGGHHGHHGDWDWDSGESSEEDDWHSGGHIPTYEMTEVCNRVLNVDNHVSAIKLSINWDDDKVHESNVDCGLNIRAPEGHRLLIQFLSMKFQSYQCKNYVEIYNGPTRSSMINPIFRRRCAARAPTALSSIGRDAYVLFHGADGNEKCEFTLMVTPFHYNSCEGEEDFKCKNKRCVDRRLRCNGYNNCGDNTDVENCEHYMKHHRYKAWWKCLIGGLVLIVALVITIACTVRCCRKRRALRQKEATAAAVIKKPGALPVISADDKKAIEAGLTNNWFVPQNVQPTQPPAYTETSGVPVFLTPPDPEKGPLEETAPPMEEKPTTVA